MARRWRVIFKLHSYRPHVSANTLDIVLLMLADSAEDVRKNLTSHGWAHLPSTHSIPNCILPDSEAKVGVPMTGCEVFLNEYNLVHVSMSLWARTSAPDGWL